LLKFTQATKLTRTERKSGNQIGQNLAAHSTEQGIQAEISSADGVATLSTSAAEEFLAFNTVTLQTGQRNILQNEELLSSI
jgi:hypothetical protein